ncbi:MAG: hypothetical protein ACR2PL_26785 [Dehalococcoidia bacterium]
MQNLDSPDQLLLDTCCLLNLHATRRIEEIFRALNLVIAIVDRVSREAMYLRRGGGDEDADEHERIDLQPLIAKGFLRVLRLEVDEEFTSFVRFAADLDDGEAMTCAVAVHRGAMIATDDRKTLRILAGRAPHTEVYTTARLIKHWADAHSIVGPELKPVLLDIQERTHFFPGRHEPLREWWEAQIR